MDTKEHTKLKAIYDSWSSDKIARCIATESNDYRPEAIIVMREVLADRGVSDDFVAGFLPPPSLQSIQEIEPVDSSGFFPKRLNRWSYFVRSITLTGVLIGIAALSMPYVEGSIWMIFPLLLILVGASYGIWWVQIPRVRSIGWSPWILLLGLVPVASFILPLLLLFVPQQKCISRSI